MLELLTQPQTYVSLLSLTLLEIVLGIDNIIFISILAGKLPESQREKARVWGLMIALLGRLVLVASIFWLIKLTQPLVVIKPWVALSAKDLIMLFGGLFLVAKSAKEIYEKVEAVPHAQETLSAKAKTTFMGVVVQIMLIDLVFSVDSILTAVGLVSEVAIMIMAILVSMGVMLASAGGIGAFIERHPSIKVLALSFLLMIGTLLVAEAFHAHIPKGYVYFSLAFALAVEWLNIKANQKALLNTAVTSGH
ncbi:MAG: TerC family protein [Vampirovibrionales bacterium]|nr:TerC family protein [Vampirovibrionales bacterium]